MGYHGHMLIGYARVSTDDQDLRGQVERLTTHGCARLFQEKISGAHADRPELRKLLEHVRSGDVIVVCRLDRLARSTRDLLGIAENLKKLGVGIKSLAEPWADTTSPAGVMVLTVFAGIAEFERALIRERTGSGRTAAMRRGVRFGRPSKRTDEKTTLALRLLGEGKSVPQVAKTLGIHYATLYRWMAKTGASTTLDLESENLY
jgi:DNA invertase Pin-like site-specific DNA recombinase